MSEPSGGSEADTFAGGEGELRAASASPSEHDPGGFEAPMAGAGEGFSGEQAWQGVLRLSSSAHHSQPDEELYRGRVVAAVDPESKGPTQLRIWKLAATGLIAADRGGTSDPYAKVSFMGGKPRETTVVKRTVNPKWGPGDDFTFEAPEEDILNPDNAVIKVALFDRDLVTADDPLGVVSIPFDDLFGREEAEYNGSWPVYHKGRQHGTFTARLVVLGRGAYLPPPRVHTRLSLTNMSAQGLRAADRGGTSDPFAKVSCAGATLRTEVIKAKLDPVWEHCDFRFGGPADGHTLDAEDFVSVDLFDHDAMGSNDSLGTVTIPIANLWGTESESPSTPSTHTVFYKGQAHGSLTCTLALSGGGTHPSEKRHVPTTLTITNMSASDLRAADRGGTSDPYAVITAAGSRQFKTHVVGATLDPAWEGAQMVFMGTALDEEADIRVQVYDHDRFSKDDLLGEATIPIADLWGDTHSDVPMSVPLIHDTKCVGRFQCTLHLSGHGTTFARRVPTRLAMWDVRARGLMAADAGGASDPYLRATCGGVVRSTVVVHKTLDPEWPQADFRFSHPALDDEEYVCVEVFDHDAVSRDDNLGTCDIPIIELWGKGGEVVDAWFPVYHKGTPQGEVHVCMQLFGVGTTFPREAPTVLTVSTLRATGLRSCTRPYAVLKAVGLTFKSSVAEVADGDDVAWPPADSFTVRRGAQLDACHTVEVEVWNKNRMRPKDTLLGVATVPIASLWGQGAPVDVWWPVYHDRTPAGYITATLSVAGSAASHYRQVPTGLRVTELQGRGLRAADRGGTSDPYCRLVCAKQKFRTATVPKTLDPEWPASDFRFSGVGGDLDEEEVCVIQVYDEDRVGSDDLLGVVEVPILGLWGGDGEEVRGWYPVMYRGEQCGELHVCVALSGDGLHEARVAPSSLHLDALTVSDVVLRSGGEASERGPPALYAKLACAGQVLTTATRYLQREQACSWPTDALVFRRPQELNVAEGVYVEVWDNPHHVPGRRRPRNNPFMNAAGDVGREAREEPPAASPVLVAIAWLPITHLWGNAGADHMTVPLYRRGLPVGTVSCQAYVAGMASRPEASRLEPTAIRVSNLSAAGLLAADSGGTSDPYVVFRTGAECEPQKTSVIYKTLDPVWAGEEVVFGGDDAALADFVEANLFDKDLVSDDPLGSVRVPVGHLWGARAAPQDVTFPVLFRGQPHGTLSLTVAVTGDGSRLPKTIPENFRVWGFQARALRPSKPPLDPRAFLVLKCGGRTVRTTVADVSREPVWPAVDEFSWWGEEVTDSDKLHVEVWYRGVNSDDQLGTVSVPMKVLRQSDGRQMKAWFKIKGTGSLRICFLHNKPMPSWKPLWTHVADSDGEDEGEVDDSAAPDPDAPVYDGPLEGGLRHGVGKLTWPDGTVYAGYFQFGLREGRGTITHADGTHYDGQWRGDERNGVCVVMYPNGDKFDGLAKDDEIHFGSLIHPNGDKYHGKFKNGLKDDKEGVQWYINGDIVRGQFQRGDVEGLANKIYPEVGLDGHQYNGYFVRGNRQGKGNMTWCRGEYLEYDGEWFMDMRTGTGRMQYRNGDWYEGEWFENKHHGQGTFYDNNTRNKYSGTWVHHHMHGKGNMKYGSGEEYAGDWVQDIRVGYGTLVEDDRYSTYTGDFWDDQRWGYGTMKYGDDTVYTGFYERHERHGIGRQTFPEGHPTNLVYYDGEWAFDHMCGVGGALYRDGSMYDGGWKLDVRFDGAAFRAPNGAAYIGEYRRGERFGRLSRGVVKSDGGDVYEGELYMGQRVGWGKCVYANGDRYEGNWTEDKRGGGKGLFEQLSVANGDAYIGLWQEDAKNCQGRMQFANGDEYTGLWLNDTMHGYGKIVYAVDGTVYEGEFDRNVRRGQATTWYPNGDKHVGKWDNDRRNGPGVVAYADSSIYKGTFKDDARVGPSTFRWPNGNWMHVVYVDDVPSGPVSESMIVYENGDKYTGPLRDGVSLLRLGKGTMQYADGRAYVGDWLDSEITGHGVMDYPDGKYSGDWLNGQYHGRGLYVHLAAHLTFEVYDGDWVHHVRTGSCSWKFWDGGVYRGTVRDNLRHGSGRHEYPNGDVYDGEFLDDIRVGHGVLTWNGGASRIDCTWASDLPNGRGLELLADASRYAGNFVNRIREGRGVLWEGNGVRFDGDFHRNLKHGQGEQNFPDGVRYRGEFQFNVMHGQGVLDYPTGDKYVGEMLDDERLNADWHGVLHYPPRREHGKARMAPKQVAVPQPEDEDGDGPDVARFALAMAGGVLSPPSSPMRRKLAPPVVEEPSVVGVVPPSARAVYTGQFRGLDRHGEGVCEYGDGGKYVGTWVEDLWDGTGTLQQADGGQYIGQWERGMRNGSGEQQHNADGRAHGFGGEYMTHVGDRYKGTYVDDDMHGPGTYWYADGSVYTGQWDRNIRQGRGHFTFADGSTYEGGWGNDTWNGSGVRVYPEGMYPKGTKYVGPFVDGKRHGQGTLTFPDGSEYVGGFAGDVRFGRGVMTWPNGDVYDGTWEGDERTWHYWVGTKVYANGDVYKGEFQYEDRHGKGSLVCADGSSYTGDYALDRPHGFGHQKYANGDEYKGEWQRGLRNGVGLFTYKSSATYRGQWVDDLRQGHGVMKYADGGMYTGDWHGDKRNGRGRHEYPPPSQDVYEGDFVDDIREGRGVLIMLGFGVYTGPFHNDVRHGLAIEEYENGEQYVGEFKGGSREGAARWTDTRGNIFQGHYTANSKDVRAWHGRVMYDNGDVYNGEMRGNKRHGKGHLKCSNLVEYVGTFAKDHLVGVGTIRTWDYSYEGDVVASLRHGKGVCKWANGDRYEGPWLEDNRHGVGICTFADGSRYNGTWVHDDMRGHTLRSYANGDRYMGVMLHGVPHGRGTYYRANGDEYDGEFVNGQRHGFGIALFPSRHERYEGQWQDDAMHGRGKFLYEDHGAYEGEWQRGCRHGKGNMQYPDGEWYTGMWEDDMRHGWGQHRFRNDSTFTGAWVKDEPSDKDFFIRKREEALALPAPPKPPTPPPVEDSNATADLLHGSVGDRGDALSAVSSPPRTPRLPTPPSERRRVDSARASATLEGVMWAAPREDAAPVDDWDGVLPQSGRRHSGTPGSPLTDEQAGRATGLQPASVRLPALGGPRRTQSARWDESQPVTRRSISLASLMGTK